MPQNLSMVNIPIIEAPDFQDKVLLHSCCAPCSLAMVEALINSNIQPTIFYFNPNIFPQKEYEIRKDENKRFAEQHHLPFIDFDYEHRNWLKETKAFSNEPERGIRCAVCFSYRLEVTAAYAYENGFSLFATTLATSRWKDVKQITAEGHKAAEKYPNVKYWDRDWRKNGFTERKNQLNKEKDFYNQQYCGCEYSLRDVNKWRISKGKPKIEL